jgi:hypothetical protein
MLDAPTTRLAWVAAADPKANPVQNGHKPV